MEQKTQATLAYKILKKNVYNACFEKGQAPLFAVVLLL